MVEGIALPGPFGNLFVALTSTNLFNPFLSLKLLLTPAASRGSQFQRAVLTVAKAFSFTCLKQTLCRSQ